MRGKTVGRAGRLIVLVAVVAMIAAACSSGDGGGATPTPTGTGSTALRVAFQADISSFDPDNNFEVAGLGAITAVYQGLVHYKTGTTEVEGLLAESWDVTKGDTLYTFHLRPGVTFHDGTPMTSAEVKASFERRWKDDSLILNYFLLGVKKMSAPDPETFVMELSGPDPAFLDNLSSAWGPKVIGPSALTDHAGDDGSQTYLNENADGTGPYTLDSFDRGQKYVLKAFPDYWGTAPHFQTVEIAIIPEIGQQILQIKKGDLDMVLHGYPFAQLDSLPDGLEVLSYNDLGLEMAYVNPNKLTTRDQRLRVEAALDPNAWVADAFGSYATPPSSLFPKAMIDPGTPLEWPSLESVPQVDVPAVEIVYTAEEAAVQQRVAELMVAQLNAAGIDATARALPQDQVINFPSDPKSGPTLVIAQNNPDSAHPSTQSGLFYATGGPLNLFGYSNPQADDLFNQGYPVTDVDRRDALYLQGSAVLFNDGGFYPLADVQDVIVYRSGLTGLETRPAIPWNVDFGTVTEG
jgi:peptide/nickel transport system substrate-binding protein